MIITLHGEGEKPAPKRKHKSDDIRLASVEELLDTASRVVEFVHEDSKFLNADILARVPQFSDREIATGGIIGRGGFCIVRDIDRIHVTKRGNSFRSNKSSSSALADTTTNGASGFGGILSLCFKRDNSDDRSMSLRSMDNSLHSRTGKEADVDSISHKYKYTREHVASRSKKTRKNGGRYVLKSLNKDVDKITYMKGNVDIAMEAKFLAVLDHPNIIEMVAVSKSRPCTPGYFLILEKMTDTLTGRIKKWMDKERMYKGFAGFLTGGRKKELQLYYERIAAAYDIASGLFYLHSNNIVFRDLKPANIGFDCHDQLKLFDFGLAKELKDKDLRDDGTYRNMTATTGAIRYSKY
jgi:serine/threonine protein kinase